jgi:hypothetical protein
MPEMTEGAAIVRAVSLGPAAAEIVKYAQREKIDVIVLGTHGRSGVARLILGSVAEEVVRTSPCQVLTIGPRYRRSNTAAAKIPRSYCLVCAKPSPSTICDSCKIHIQGEAIDRKRREEQPGHRGLSL